MKEPLDISFKIIGNPIALKRHRTFRKGDFVGQYDPSQGDKASFLIQAMEHKPDEPFDEPLHVRYTFAFGRPKSHFRTGARSNELKPSAPMYHTGKPDLDNLEKFTNDSLNKVFWRDDSVICSVTAEKIYTTTPYIRISITRINKSMT